MRILRRGGFTRADVLSHERTKSIIFLTLARKKLNRLDSYSNLSEERGKGVRGGA